MCNNLVVKWLWEQHGHAAALATAWQCRSFGNSMAMHQLWQQHGMHQLWQQRGGGFGNSEPVQRLWQQCCGAVALLKACGCSGFGNSYLAVMLSDRETASWGRGGSSNCFCIASGDSDLDSKMVIGENEATINWGKQQALLQHKQAMNRQWQQCSGAVDNDTKKSNDYDGDATQAW